MRYIIAAENYIKLFLCAHFPARGIKMWERAPGAIEPVIYACIESLFHPLACSVLAVLMREKRSSQWLFALLFVKWHIGSVGNHLYMIGNWNMRERAALANMQQL
jgi:hypothetical protein